MPPPTEEPGGGGKTQNFRIGTPVSSRGSPSKRKGENNDLMDQCEAVFGSRSQSRMRPRSPTESMATDDPAAELDFDDEDAAIDAQMLSMNLVDRKIIAATLLGVDITEVYSPERLAQVVKRYGLTAGSSMDLTNGWDFNQESHKKAAWRQIAEESPYLLIGSPPVHLL